MTASFRPGRRALLAVLAAIATLGALAAAPASARTTRPTHAAARSTAAVQRACGEALTGRRARCFAQFRTRVLTQRSGKAAGVPTALPMTPARLRSAYQVPSGLGAGQTVALIDAYDDPKAESDLAIYRKKYGLPACTTANGCFRKVNQRGRAAPLPDPDEGWGVEISLDLDAVSAVCPACHLLLVEGDSDALESLGAAVNTAVRLGADVVSNSYGAEELGGMRTLARRYYTHPGVAIVASTGDDGFVAASFPAVLPNVVAVGGTTLRKATGTSRGWTERAWAGAGSGCSAYIAKPAWQPGTHCLMRMVADVSAVADPNTGLLVIDNFGYSGTMEVGGTSLSAPLIAAMIALAGNASAVHDASGIYAHPNALWDVVGGSNGYCGGDYLCTAKTGYDGPTGMGTPHGLGAL